MSEENDPATPVQPANGDDTKKRSTTRISDGAATASTTASPSTESPPKRGTMVSSTQGAAAKATPNRNGTARRATFAPTNIAAMTAALSSPELNKSGAWPFACVNNAAATGKATAQKANSVRT